MAARKLMTMPRSTAPARAAKSLSHLDEQGQARMVDVGAKPVTSRRASARALVRLPQACARALEGRHAPKGDVLAVARIAGIQAAKRTSELIPLCHALPLDGIEIAFTRHARGRVLEIICTASCRGPTGVEMEALTGAGVAALCVYDMLKALSQVTCASMPLELLEKHGGRSGSISRRVGPSGGRP